MGQWRCSEKGYITVPHSYFQLAFFTRSLVSGSCQQNSSVCLTVCYVQWKEAAAVLLGVVVVDSRVRSSFFLTYLHPLSVALLLFVEATNRYPTSSLLKVAPHNHTNSTWLLSLCSVICSVAGRLTVHFILYWWNSTAATLDSYCHLCRSLRFPYA